MPSPVTKVSPPLDKRQRPSARRMMTRNFTAAGVRVVDAQRVSAAGGEDQFASS